MKSRHLLLLILLFLYFNVSFSQNCAPSGTISTGYSNLIDQNESTYSCISTIDPYLWIDLHRSYNITAIEVKSSSSFSFQVAFGSHADPTEDENIRTGDVSTNTLIKVSGNFHNTLDDSPYDGSSFDGQYFAFILPPNVCISEIKIYGVKGQPVEYAYDAGGNRIRREIIVLGSISNNLEVGDSLKSAPIFNPTDPYEELFGKDKVVIYPNPTKGNLIVEIKSAANFDANIAVYDLKGTLLFNLTHALESNPVDFSTYSVGPYILMIQIGDKKKEWKIIKE